MIIIQFLVVLFFIYCGSRLGSIGIGCAGGMGVLALSALGVPAGIIPFDVIQVIMSVITTVAALQLAGSIDYLVMLAEKLLRNHPKRITLLAPIVTYTMTLIAGTGHKAFFTLPVITEVAKEHGIRPSRPLSLAVVASQLGIIASPISAAVIFLTELLAPHQMSYFRILGILIPSSFIGILLTATICSSLGAELADDPLCQSRLKDPSIATSHYQAASLKPYAKRGLIIFLVAIFAVIFYSTFSSCAPATLQHALLTKSHATISIMLTAATLIIVLCKLSSHALLSTSVFSSGMSACICVLGVAWLGDTFISAHLPTIQALSGNLLQSYPWLFTLIVFFVATLLYSQAATAKALFPAALAFGITPLTLIISFPAVSALFILPTYPTLLAAIEMDDTGSTRIGRFIFNHSFFLPGILAIFFSIMCAYGMTSFL